jgi:hypothetical protein
MSAMDLDTAGWEIASTAAAFDMLRSDALVKADAAKWWPIIKESGIKPQ